MYDCPAVGASSPQGGGTEIVSWAPALPFPWLLLRSHQLHSVQTLPRTHCHGICETQARPGGKSVFNFWPASLVPQPSVLGVGASMVMQPAQHPGSLSRTVGGGPQVPPVGVREPSLLANTTCLEAQMGSHSGIGDPRASDSGSQACGSYMLSQLCACSASCRSLVIRRHGLSLVGPPFSSFWPKAHVES